MAELLKDFLGGEERPQLLRVFLGRQAQDKAVFKQLQGEAPDIAGIRRHIAVKIVHKAVQGVDVDPGVNPEAEKPGLVVLARLAEQFHGVVGADGLLLNGQRLVGQLPHPGLHSVQKGPIQGKIALSQNE